MTQQNNGPSYDTLLVPQQEESAQAAAVPPLAGCVAIREVVKVQPEKPEYTTYGGAALRIYGQPETD